MRPELNRLSTPELVAALLDSADRVVPAVRECHAELAAAAERLAGSLERGGRALFLGAGTSGRMAVAEAAELPGTFGVPPAQILGRLAGAEQHGLTGGDGDEDDEAAGRRHVAEVGLAGGDVLIAVAASGRTPYTVAAAQSARRRGAAVLAVVGAEGSPLAELAEVAVVAAVGPELLRGSTRTDAGTAQKVALNTLTTAAMVHLGHVHGDLMVDVVAANAKLRERAVGIVAEICGCDAAAARRALADCAGSARSAVLRVVLGLEPAAAQVRAAQHRTLRAALGDPEPSPASGPDIAHQG